MRQRGSRRAARAAPTGRPAQDEPARDDASALLALLARAAVTVGEAATLEQAVPALLDDVSRLQGLDRALLWRVGPDDRLTLGGSWTSGQPGAGDTPGAAGEEELPDPIRELPTQALRTGRVRWAAVEAAPDAASDVRCALAVPVTTSRGVAAILELLSRNERAPADSLLAALTSLGSMLGQLTEGQPAIGLARVGASRSAGEGTAAGGDWLLSEALRRGEFSLVYQPQVSLVSDRMDAAEALLRWNRPDGPVPPDVFIPFAEATGEIVPLGEWVLNAACEQAARWRLDFPDLRPWGVAVNISAVQFRAGLVETVRSALQESGLDPQTLRVELTETMLIEDVDLARAVLSELRVVGVSVSLDDFGTGYSSLAYFRHFDLDEVKIDRAFVRGLGENRGDTAVIASVVSLAHALDRNVVAEGVETRAQAQHLRSLGCDLAQGYLFARPMPAADMHPLLTDRSTGGTLRGQDTPRDDRAAQLATVLVVDDAADLRSLVRVSLTAAGFLVHECASGRDALKHARAVQPDCVLLDMNLGDVDGLDVCRALRADSETAGCRILMLTGASERTTKAEAFRAGADDYIVKPVSPRDLASRVQRAVG